ncbi:MAG TPA: ankyrin repeat domain-containing protein [Chthonomonadaceae bacterium]|nr:ankyrin repeat domain-containing protein [Chthonomonadaceae bacterium]
MTPRYRFLFSLLLLSAIVTAAIFASTSSGALLPGQKPGKPPVSRTSTDPPVAAQGKLGQDLFLAVMHGDLAGVKSLLKRGADPNARNGLLFTPLYLAAATGQTPGMEALLDAGAQLEATSPYGTPLTFAAMGGSAPAIHLLVSRGANVNVARTDGLTPLILASRAGALDGIRELLQQGAQVNARDNDGATALTFAAREGNVEAARLLLSAGAPVDGADSHGWTPLTYAAVNGHSECVAFLLDKGANPNARDAKGRTPLLLTSAYGDYPEVVRALLKGGADAAATDAGHHNARALAVGRGHGDCASLLGETVPPAAGPRRSARQAVQVSLKTLQHSMLVFNRHTGCVSCHQDGLGRITTGAARERGFVLDPAADHAQSERIVGTVNALAPLHAQALKNPEVMKNLPLYEIGEIPTTYSFLLAGMAAQKQPATAATGAMAMVLARQQSPDGSWIFMLPRIPMQSSNFTFTALSLLSLKAYGPRADAAEIAARIRRARAWLLAAPAVTNEDRSFRLLGLKWAWASEAERRQALDDLRAQQRPDGGWSQQAGLQSDAYATGQALYALHAAGGLPIADPVYRRGVAFLLRTQDEDGSWFVNKRAMPANNYFNAGFPHGESQYASFNGTCWATLALLQTLNHA